MKNFKKFLCIALAIVLLAVSFTACGKKDDAPDTDENKTTNNSNETNDNTTIDKIVNEDGDEFVVDMTTKGEIEANAEGINSNKFTVVGTTFTLPGNTSDLFNAGWHLSSNMTFDNNFEPESQTSLISFYLYPPEEIGYSISLRSIYNENSENKPIEECKLTGIDLDSYYISDDADFVLPGGITEKSTAADVLSVYGNPYNNSNFEYGYNWTETLSYENHNATGLTYSFHFNDDGTLYSVHIEYEM